MKEAQVTEDQTIKEIENKIQIQNKTLTVLSKEENMSKLRNLVEKGNERLIDLAEQWNQVQTPLLEEYQALQHSLSTQEVMALSSLICRLTNLIYLLILQMKTLQDSEKLKNAHETYHQLLADIKERELVEQELIQKCEKLNKTTNR